MRLLLWLSQNQGAGKMIRMLMRQSFLLPLVEGIFDLPDGTTLVVGIVEYRDRLPGFDTPGYVIVDGQYTFYVHAHLNLLHDCVGKHVTIVLRQRQPTVEGGPDLADT